MRKRKCKFCNGRGKEIVNPGNYQVQIPCKKCYGKGFK